MRSGQTHPQKFILLEHDPTHQNTQPDAWTGFNNTHTFTYISSSSKRSKYAACIHAFTWDCVCWWPHLILCLFV